MLGAPDLGVFVFGLHNLVRTMFCTTGVAIFGTRDQGELLLGADEVDALARAFA